MRWREVPGFPGIFVSEQGQLRRGPLGASLPLSRSDSGYLRAKPWIDGRHRSLLCHRAVLLAFVGPPPPGRPHGAHKNGNKDDNRRGNLRWRRPVSNERDKRRHGTVAQKFSGYRPGARQVARIRRLLALGKSYSDIAKMVGMHRHSISRIARGLRHGRRA